MATKTKIAIVDSSALMSVVNVADQLHDDAVRIDEVLTNDDWLVLLPREVFAETINAIGKKISRRDAVVVGRAVVERFDKRDFEFIQAERPSYDEALRLQALGKGTPSFVDCLVMALASEYETDYIFGFDATFKKNGFLLPKPGSGRASAA